MSNSKDSEQKGVPQHLSIILLGESTVGKSCLIARYINNQFNSTYLSTFGVNFFSKSIQVSPSQKITVKIWDTAGQERFKSIAESYYKKAQGVLLVYDVTKKETFEKISEWIGNLQKHSKKSPVCSIIGNKIDLTDEIEVSTEEGKQLAEKYGCFFHETSAQSGVGVNQAFEELGKQCFIKNGGVIGEGFELTRQASKKNFKFFDCFKKICD